MGHDEDTTLKYQNIGIWTQSLRVDIDCNQSNRLIMRRLNSKSHLVKTLHLNVKTLTRRGNLPLAIAFIKVSASRGGKHSNILTSSLITDPVETSQRTCMTYALSGQNMPWYLTVHHSGRSLAPRSRIISTSRYAGICFEVAFHNNITYGQSVRDDAF